MAKYIGGMQVGGGYYWNARNWEVEVVSNEGGKLKGGADARYAKVPFPALFLIVPLLGALFLMFLPLIGFLVTLHAIASLIVRAVHGSATELAATVSPGFVPGVAHFTGKAGERAGVEEKGPTTRGDALEALAAEIARRRSLASKV